MVPNLGIMFDNLKEEKKKLYDESKIFVLQRNTGESWFVLRKKLSE